jgi:CheY-like chemotaxis protein
MTAITPHLVLLVDDHRLTLKVTARLLSRLQFEVVTASNGAEAVERFVPGRFACILMDCRMPTMDGFEATRQIRALEAGSGDRVPIVGATGERLAETRALCIRAGMDDCLAKPLDVRVLQRALRRWIGRGSTGRLPVVDRDYLNPREAPDV